MRHKKAKRESLEATRAIVKKEMARPRMAMSARIMERSLNKGRIPEPASTIMPGTVDKIRKHPEKAQIGVDRASRWYRSLRIENSLTDENGDEVKLKRGARVEVTVAVEGKTSTTRL
jgi:hypothetical protein